jgi:hypothetical protein
MHSSTLLENPRSCPRLIQGRHWRRNR